MTDFPRVLPDPISAIEGSLRVVDGCAGSACVVAGVGGVVDRGGWRGWCGCGWVVDKGLATMTAAELRVILEHVPDDLPVFIAGRGEVVSCRRPVERYTTPGVYLDVRGPRLRGLFRDRRTLNVRLEGLAS